LDEIEALISKFIQFLSDNKCIYGFAERVRSRHGLPKHVDDTGAITFACRHIIDEANVIEKEKAFVSSAFGWDIFMWCTIDTKWRERLNQLELNKSANCKSIW